MWFLLFWALLMRPSVAKPLSETAIETAKLLPPDLELITQDIIHDDIEQNVKKVIRVKPLDLPSLTDDTAASNMDSSLYNIKTLKPYTGQKKYNNLQRLKPATQVTIDSNYSKITRTFSLLPSSDKTSKAKHQPKQKTLHFLYNQEEDITKNLLSKSMPVHVAAGAYPVYYMVAKTNGRFGKYPLKSFGNTEDFRKYLQKSKIENISDRQYNEEKV